MTSEAVAGGSPKKIPRQLPLKNPGETICLTEKDEEKVANSIKGRRLCQSNLNDCESSLDKALNVKVDTSWYQEPIVIGSAVVTAILIGFVAGQATH